MWSIIRKVVGGLICAAFMLTESSLALACDPGCSVVFSDRFGTNSLSKWFPVAGDWSLATGKLRGVGWGGGVDAWIYAIPYNKPPKSIIIDVDANMVTGNAQIVFDSTGHWLSEYRVEFWANTTYDYANTYVVMRFRNGEATVLTKGVDGHAVAPVPIPQQSHLRVTRFSDEISLYVNGRFVATVIDSEPVPEAGTFGLGVIWDWIATYDNFIVQTCPNK